MQYYFFHERCSALQLRANQTNWQSIWPAPAKTPLKWSADWRFATCCSCTAKIGSPVWNNTWSNESPETNGSTINFYHPTSTSCPNAAPQRKIFSRCVHYPCDGGRPSRCCFIAPTCCTCYSGSSRKCPFSEDTTNSNTVNSFAQRLRPLLHRRKDCMLGSNTPSLRFCNAGKST